MADQKDDDNESASSSEEDEEKNEFWWRRGIVQAPRQIVQWDHVDESRQSKGIAEKGRKVTWSELFLDLVLVTNVGKLGEAYQSGNLSLIEALVLYRLIYECWLRTTEYAGRFFVDDVVDKLANGVLMFLLVVAGLRIGEFEFVESAGLVARAGGVYQLVMGLVWARTLWALPDARTHMGRHGLAPSVAFGLAYLLVAHVVTAPTPLLVCLVVLNWADPVWHAVGYVYFTLPKKVRVPVHVAHLVERRGCLRLILFGEVVTGVTVGTSRCLGVAIPVVGLAFLILYDFKLLAFDVDVVPLKRHCYRAMSFWRPVIYLEAAWWFDASMGRQPNQMGPRGEAHILLCACFSVGVAALTLERLMHDNSRVLGEHHWLNVVSGPTLQGCTNQKARKNNAPVSYGLIDATDRVHLAERRVFLFQIAFHVFIVLAGILLAVYCHSVHKDYEEDLVLTCLAALATVAVAVNLLDEIHAITGRAVV
ncbi:hypothetical protein CTAYLR_009773 [Chrysophaeum taylorii]|uniref:Uncharacterized protein n=1 Tax=Chrysophaeum taylorii TaxID=2483200 RepID=A0AAD7UFJ3_9STRA|nr:hypothetical protein CTAYLR_009773 [Chrysophaeum taylorii]